MQWFFFQNIFSDIIEFDTEESKHCVRVLRLRKGDRLNITDGKGRILLCTLIDDHVKKCIIRVDEDIQCEPQRDFSIQIAVSPTKNIARFEWFIEKATEIGIDKIFPLASDHSERIHLNHDRLQKILISAIKQSQQPWLPELTGLTTFAHLISSGFNGQRFIAYVDENHQTTLKNACKPGCDVLILIGPEGDFSQEEVKEAVATGFIPVSLGPNRLRTETAALVACHTVALINQV